mmetsp:Transcript_16270/g.47563  ORF Transcript_16270/g.47563 Transcript_16270/m.47563 type:complete len:256 (-) Transcript_16270:64-831(-)
MFSVVLLEMRMGSWNSTTFPTASWSLEATLRRTRTRSSGSTLSIWLTTGTKTGLTLSFSLSRWNCWQIWRTSDRNFGESRCLCDSEFPEITRIRTSRLCSTSIGMPCCWDCLMHIFSTGATFPSSHPSVSKSRSWPGPALVSVRQLYMSTPLVHGLRLSVPAGCDKSPSDSSRALLSDDLPTPVLPNTNTGCFSITSRAVLVASFTTMSSPKASLLMRVSKSSAVMWSPASSCSICSSLTGATCRFCEQSLRPTA